MRKTDTSTNKPGSNIDSWCGKCKMVLAHTIEAMVGDKPARVHCNTCKSQHAYRANPPGSNPRSSAKPRATRHQTLLNKMNSAVPKPYSPKEKYELGDVLEHAIFGRGVATAVKDGSKIEVLFESGSKTLIHER
jgi:hypothetical protein